MDKENPRASHSSKRPHKRRKVSDEASKSNGAIILLEEQPVEIGNGPSFTPDALSVGDVLENIFHFLNGKDLECCKLVNQRWNYFVGQFYTRHFEVTIRPGNPLSFERQSKIEEQNHVTITKLDWSSKRSDRKKFSFPDAVALLLEEASKERKFAIDVVNFNPKCAKDPDVENFLSKIGHLVFEFTPNSTRNDNLDPLGRLSSRHFPNLCYLDLSHVNITFFCGPSREDDNKYLTSSVFIKLKKISFGRCLEHFDTPYSTIKLAESFIKMAPNLKEIHEFPVQFVDALISTGKSNTVKSICYPDYALVGEQFYDDHYKPYFNKETNKKLTKKTTGGPLEIAIKKFAQLKPKLSSFSFSVTYPTITNRHKILRGHYPTKYLYLENLKPSIYEILQSSHQSLETLALYPSESFDFEEISPMTSLKKIRFLYGAQFGDFKLIPENIDLERIFPNVTVVEIVMCYSGEVKNFAPPTLLPPWGSQITELVLKELFRLDSTTMKSLAESFPSVKIFKYLGSDGLAPDNLSWLLPLMGELWPGMEVITIRLEDESSLYNAAWSGYSFDHLFTGIPKKSLSQLKTRGRRKKISKELQSFYANSAIRKLSNLQTLELDFQYFSGAARDKVLRKLTKTCTFLSKEFGFDFLPPTFKILVRETGAEKIFSYRQDIKKIQKHLSSVVALEFETIKTDVPHFFH